MATGPCVQCAVLRIVTRLPPQPETRSANPRANGLEMYGWMAASLEREHVATTCARRTFLHSPFFEKLATYTSVRMN